MGKIDNEVKMNLKKELGQIDKARTKTPEIKSNPVLRKDLEVTKVK